MATVIASLEEVPGAAAALPAAARPEPVSVSASPSFTERLVVAVIAVGAVFGVWGLTLLGVKDAWGTVPEVSAPVDGLTIFAVFFVAAAALERLLEPLAGVIQAKPAETASAAVATASNTATELAGDATSDDAETKAAMEGQLVAVAGAKATTVRVSEHAKVGLWAVASIAGILAAASLKLYLLQRVGIAAPPRALDILATGLVIGAGTKPMHDLVKLIEAKKETATATAAGAAEGS